MIRLRMTLLLAGLGVAGALLSVVALSPPHPGTAQSTTPPSDCALGARTSADPASLVLGDTAQVTTVITHSCGPFTLPMDLVFLVDISNSMTKSRRDPGIGQTGTPKPSPGPGPGGTQPPPPTPIIIPLQQGSAPSERVRGLAQGIQTSTPVPVHTPGTPGTPFPGIPSPTPKGGIGGDEQPGTEDLVKEVRDAIMQFLEERDVQAALDNGQLQIGLVTFNDHARTEVALTNKDGQVRSKLLRLRGMGNTNVGLGLRQADLVLRGGNRVGKTETDRVKVVLLYSDGKFDERTLRGANTRDQTKVVTVAAGRSANVGLMRRLATQRDFAVTTREHKELMKIYRTDLPVGRPVTLEALTVRQELAPNMAVISDTIAPAPNAVSGARLEWVLPKPAARVTLTYQVRPLEAGVHPVWTLAEATTKDSEGRDGTLAIPNVDVEALAPTETPTPTPTDTATPTATNTPTNTVIPPTPTPTPGPNYLPVALKDQWLYPTPTPGCIPSQQTVDVTLVIDTSNSMLDPTQPGGQIKLDAAIEAALGFLDYLKLPADGSQDQVAVVWFNTGVGLETPLTGDRATVEAAIRRLPLRQAPGTRIDKGLDTAYAEMVGPRHRAQNNRAVILVTDGHQEPGSGGRDAVLAAADQIKAAGITLWTIGLGVDADQDLLREAATSPDFYKYAPNAEDLRLIYEEIARVVPCS
jgi:Mg-chelatase subunit ChlD